MEDAKRIAIAGHKQVLEEGPDVRESESDSEHSDHCEQWSNADTHTPDMLGPGGKPMNGDPQQFSAEEADALRTAAFAKASQSEEPAVVTRTPTPLNSDEDSEQMSYEQKRAILRLRPKKSASAEGRAGSPVTVRAPG
jgi:hypothetical protein